MLFAGLLLAVPALAAGAEREIEREVDFGLDAEGFTVRVYVSNDDGDVNATMIVYRGPRVAYCSAPAKVTAERVTARFGRLGELARSTSSTTASAGPQDRCLRRPRRSTRRDDGRSRGGVGGRSRCLPLGPREGHRDAAAAGAFHRLGDFTRHGHEGHGTWKGSLGMPIFGGEPVKLAGGHFRAFIHEGVPQDE